MTAANPNSTFLTRNVAAIVGGLALVTLLTLVASLLMLARVSSTRSDLEAVQAELVETRAEMEQLRGGVALFSSQATLLQGQLAELAPTVQAGLDEAVAGLIEFETSTILFDVPINEEIPISTEVVLERTLEVPINTILPIDETFDTTIQVNGPFGLDIPLDITVPIALDLPIDLKIAAGSLPMHFRRALASFPARPSYLVPNAARQEAWRAKLAELPQSVNVGISWRGGKDTRASGARSIPLEAWQPLFEVAKANFVNLQYGDHRAEIDAVHAAGLGRLHDLEDLDPIADVDGFMSLLPLLDLVVSIDNSTVFMAGAVGAPTWVLLPVSAEWRWLKDRPTSPWHASLQLFRQAAPGMQAWRALIADVAARLAKRV